MFVTLMVMTAALPLLCFSAPTLVPILECSHNYGNGTCETFYGYVNNNNNNNGGSSDTAAANQPIERSVSAANTSTNYFFPAPYDRGQPTLFEAGEHRNVFSVRWSCTAASDALVWALDQAVAVTAAATTCPLGCDNVPYSYATYDACGVCGGDNSQCNGIVTSVSIQSNGYCNNNNNNVKDNGNGGGNDNTNCGQDTKDFTWGYDHDDDDSFKGGGGGIKKSCTKSMSKSRTSSPTPSKSRSSTRTLSPTKTPTPTKTPMPTVTPTATESETQSMTLTTAPSLSITPTAQPSYTPTRSGTPTQTPSVSESATPVPTPIPGGSCPPLHVNISLDIVDNVTIRMLPDDASVDDGEELSEKRRRSAGCESPYHYQYHRQNDGGAACPMPTVEFCYVATTEVAWSALIADFAPIADDPTSCLINEPQSRCRIRLPPQEQPGLHVLCLNLTLEELLLNCTLDDGSDMSVLQTSPGDEEGQTVYSGVFYVGVVIDWDDIVDQEIFNDFPTCNASTSLERDVGDDDHRSGVLLRHSAHPFNITVNMHGSHVTYYQTASPSLDAYVAGVWWLPNGEVHIKLVTRLGMSSAGPSWLRDAAVYLPELEGVEFFFVDDFVPCDANAPDAETVCTQHWLLESVNGYDEQDFGGLKPLRFDVFVQGYGEIRTARVDLHLSLHRYWHVEQMSQDLSAALVLARDLDFEQVYVQQSSEVAAWPFFHDCDRICAKLGLCVSDDLAQYFDMVVDRVQLCTCPDALLALPFDPDDPDHTGCNTPDLPDLVSVVIYDRETNYVNTNFNFSFVSDPPELHSGEQAFCWLSKNIGSMRYLLQVRWYANGHPSPSNGDGDVNNNQRRRGILYDSTNPLAQAHGAASNVFTVGCDERLHIFVPGHGCRPKDCCNDGDGSNSSIGDFWHTWFLVISTLAICLLLAVLAMGVCRGCAHDHHEYPMLVDEIGRPAHHHHHHQHHHQQQTPPNVTVTQQWGIIGQPAASAAAAAAEDKQSLLSSYQPHRHHHHHQHDHHDRVPKRKHAHSSDVFVIGGGIGGNDEDL